LKFFGNFPGKIVFFHKIACKNRNFSEILPGKIIFFYPEPQPPRFQTRLTSLTPAIRRLMRSFTYCHASSYFTYNVTIFHIDQITLHMLLMTPSYGTLHGITLHQNTWNHITWYYTEL